MTNFVDIHLTPEELAQYGLPNLAYPVDVAAMRAVADGGLPLEAMLHGLQLLSGEGNTDWLLFEDAMSRLADLIASKVDGSVVTVSGDHWWLEVGPVDLQQKMVTIQRGNLLIAAINPREDGRLRVAVYRPLDAKSAEYLIGLGQTPHPETGVCMRANNWEYALDCSAGTGNHYAADRGEAYLSFWERGIGISSDGTSVFGWLSQKNAVARNPGVVVAELASARM